MAKEDLEKMSEKCIRDVLEILILYYIYVVLMMHKLNYSGLLNHTKSNQLEIQENVVEKVTGGTSTKESFSANQCSIETTQPKLDNIDRLSMIFESIPDPCLGITLSHDPIQLFVLSNDFIYEFFKGDEYLDNSVL